MRALISPVLFSSILLTPFAYGHSLQPAPFGSTPSEHSITLSFPSAETLSSYMVDSKGYYEHALAPMTGNVPAGIFAAEDGAAAKGSWPTSVAFDAFTPKSLSGAVGTFSGSSGSSFFHSSGGGNGSSGGLPLDLASFGSSGVGQGPGFGGKGPGLLAMLSSLETSGLGFGSEGLRDASPSVSATPLPPSWTLMLLGLGALGYVAYRSRKKGDALAAA